MGQQSIPSDPAVASVEDEPPMVIPILIVGSGIVGLTLALALHKHCPGIQVELYEQASAFQDDVGAGMGCYPNGLRVLRDISLDLLAQIQQEGHPLLFRRWERHDGTGIATANEKALLGPEDEGDELQSLGIRRWRLQRILFEAVQKEKHILVHFNKRVVALKTTSQDDDGTPVLIRKVTTVTFDDGTIRRTQLLIGADGAKSQVRSTLVGSQHQLRYTGTTSFMGTANIARDDRGLCLPASSQTKCHGAFYPTGPNEQCFQFHIPTSITDAQPHLVSWGHTQMVTNEECIALAARLRDDGWHEKYVEPLEHVEKSLKFAFVTLEPHLSSYVYDDCIALVGDAAHPPVPYLGQGAQQGLEDAGTLALLLNHFCYCSSPTAVADAEEEEEATTPLLFSTRGLAEALELYNRLRLPHTSDVLEKAKLWGRQQQKRTENMKYQEVREEKIIREVFYHDTIPVLLPATRHDYKDEATKAILIRPPKAVVVTEDSYLKLLERLNQLQLRFPTSTVEKLNGVEDVR